MRAAAAVPHMPRLSTWRGAAFVALSFVAALACSAPVLAIESTVTVRLDRAEIMRLPAGTDTIVVGNPIIADVTMLKTSGQLILTGKGFGDTNLVFLDSRGEVIAEARLLVREAAAMLVVQRGMDRETYACAPRCQPTVSLGDATAYLTRSIGDIQARNAQASGAAAAAAAPLGR